MAAWQQLSIYTSEGSRLGNRPLHSAIIATALEKGIYSAIAIKAMEGFGPQVAIPTANRLALETDLPIEVRLIDQAEAIKSFLEAHKESLANCVVACSTIEIIQGPDAIATGQ